jgi:membrane-bound lytic murein transglycosylase F
LFSLARLLICLLLPVLAGCARIEPPQAMHELVVAVREAPGFYQRDGDGYEGFDKDLAEAFAASLGLPARFIVVQDIGQAKRLLALHRAHLAVTLPLDAQSSLRYSQAFREANKVLVAHEDSLGPSEMADLAGREVAVVAGSPLAADLRALPTPPTVTEIKQVNEAALLAEIAARRLPLVAVHEINVDLANNLYPELAVRLRLPGKIGLGWAFSGEASDAAAETLRAQADAFLHQARADGLLDRLYDRHFGHIQLIDAKGIAKFIQDTQRLLPPLIHHFHLAQDATGIDWRLLAALAYQESHWDPLATSPTNVRGIMMLTEETADRLGVGNRLDPRESILAGARYLNLLKEQLDAPEPDRTRLALAGYNIGPGHLNAARSLARQQKADPNAWYEMKRILPLLAKPQYYERLKSGRARGGEAVILVENIRSYYDILVRHELPARPVAPGVERMIGMQGGSAPGLKLRH